jgi:hypothetical protein
VSLNTGDTRCYRLRYSPLLVVIYVEITPCTIQNLLREFSLELATLQVAFHSADAFRQDVTITARTIHFENRPDLGICMRDQDTDDRVPCLVGCPLPENREWLWPA